MPKKKKQQVPKWLRERIYENIDPLGYNDPESRIKDAIRGKRNFPSARLMAGGRKDAWAKYLGLKQASETFVESEYSPSKSTNLDAKYYKYSDEDNTITKRLKEYGEELKAAQNGKESSKSITGSNIDLGTYKLDFGEDEGGKYVSAYDIWDLHPFRAGGQGAKTLSGRFFEKHKEKDIGSLLGVGQPWEYYDRHYYEPADSATEKKKYGGAFMPKNKKKKPLGPHEFRPTGARLARDRRLRDYQGTLTGELALQHPSVNIDSILTANQYRSPAISTKNASQVGEGLVGQFGDISLSPERVSNLLGPEGFQEYSDFRDSRTQGSAEQGPQRFGFRSMVRPHYRSSIPGEEAGLYKHLEKKSAGGILGQVAIGAGSGALGGAAFGGIGAPIGAVIGGGIGLVKGLLGHRQENLANLAQERQTAADGMTQEPIVPPLESTRTFGSSATAPNIPTFQFGGGIPPQEGEESIDKMLIDIDGPIHGDGGIELADVEAEGGETMFRFKGPEGVERYIFSDSLMVPDTKNSFAQTSKDIHDDSSIRPDSDRIANRSKERRLKMLMALQEPLRLDAEQKTFKKGGMMPGYRRRMQLGGPSNPTGLFAGNYSDILAPTSGMFSGGANTGYGGGGTGGGGGGGGFFQGLGNSTAGLGTSLLGSLPGLLGAAGPLAQLRLANRPAEQIDLERVRQPRAPQFVDPTQAIRGIGETFGGVNRSIRETASRPGQFITSRIASGARQAGDESGVRGQYANVNAQIANRARMLGTQVDMRNAMIGGQESLTNMASRGARESARIDAITSLGNIGGQYGRDVRLQQGQGRQNAMLRELLSNAFGNMGYS